MNQRGFTLLEGLLALALVGIVLAGVLPIFLGYMDVTTRNEERSGAIAAAQMQMETSRALDPASMPESGSTGPDYVVVGDREFEVTSYYCLAASFCSTDSRHIMVEVSYGGKNVFRTESVFTKLR
jgi:prepilin-type N-terminal cleavage/methylation domain-containing protein